MRIVFKRTGGFAPSMIGCVLDTANLPPADAQQLKELVRLSEIMTGDSQVSKSARDAHVFNFQIEDDDGRIHQVKYDTVTLPDAVRPLMEFCREKSDSLLPDDI